jgi:hypothetical protein
MSILPPHSEPQKSVPRPRVSLRTLLLMLELLAAVAALQYLTAIRPARAGSVWLAKSRPATTSASTDASASPITP